MLIIFLRAVILFAVLLFTIRLMGKRQIGEMEPFELVITLVISDLACIPMADRSIPITFGIVAILTMFVVHQAIVLLSKNETFQKVLSGKPVVVIDKGGINLFALKRMNMQVNDLLQALRATNHFSIEEVDYGIMETNGQLTVVANKEVCDKQQTLPVPVILEGKWDEEDVSRNNVDKDAILSELAKRKIKLKNVVLLTVDENGRMALQAKNRKIEYFNAKERAQA